MKSARLIGVFGALAISASLLTACQSHAGAAAYVGSTRISESTVAKYIDRNAQTSTDSSSGATDNPRSQVVNVLIIDNLADRILSRQPGGSPSPAALDKAQASYMQQQGITSVAQLAAAAQPSGFTTAFATLYLAESAKLTLITTDLKDPGDGSSLLKAVGDLKIKVDVSPRYGAWNQSTLSVGSGPATPSFLQVSDSAAPENVG